MEFIFFLPSTILYNVHRHIVFHSDLGRSSFYYDRVRCRCFFFSPFASKRPRFSSLFFVGYCLFFRRLCIGCLLHLNIVAHNLHVVYCQFYACSLYRRAIAHCSATHNLCVLPVCFGVAEYIQYFFFGCSFSFRCPGDVLAASIDFELLDFGICFFLMLTRFVSQFAHIHTQKRRMKIAQQPTYHFHSV